MEKLALDKSPELIRIDKAKPGEVVLIEYVKTPKTFIEMTYIHKLKKTIFFLAWKGLGQFWRTANNMATE